MNHILSPVWIPWFAFWAVVVFVMMRMFQSIARRDRAAELVYVFSTWKTSAIEFYIERVQKWEADGVVDSDDLDLMAAAQMVLRHREIENFDAWRASDTASPSRDIKNGSES